MSQHCSVCRHPRRQEAEDLLRQGLSVRRTATEIRALEPERSQSRQHGRRWSRRSGNRDSRSSDTTGGGAPRLAIITHPASSPLLLVRGRAAALAALAPGLLPMCYQGA